MRKIKAPSGLFFVMFFSRERGGIQNFGSRERREVNPTLSLWHSGTRNRNMIMKDYAVDIPYDKRNIADGN